MLALPTETRLNLYSSRRFSKNDILPFIKGAEDMAETKNERQPLVTISSTAGNAH